MEIPGWAYVTIGVIVSALSGYIYKFMPKNGQPNMPMLLFFFIGLIFILVGVIKLILRRAERGTQKKTDSSSS